MALVRGVDADPVRSAIVAAVVSIYATLNCVELAESVETDAEYHALLTMGIDLFQDYLFARPALEALETVDPAIWDRLESLPHIV